MLLLLILLPFLTAFVLIFFDRTNQELIRNFSLFSSLIILNFSSLLLFVFDPSTTHFQLLAKFSWFDFLNINLIFGVDGLALIMVLLTAFLIPVCILLC